MPQSKLQKILETTPKSKTKQVLDDLQYNLTSFLNEDVYLDQFNDKDSIFWIYFFEKNKLIYISQEEERVILTPAGQTVLSEINSLLLYLD